MGAVQGGYVLAQTARDVTPMAASIDMALAHIESLSASSRQTISQISARDLSPGFDSSAPVA
jgi:hypothetical protein